MPRRRNWPEPPPPLYNSDYESSSKKKEEDKPKGNLFSEVLRRVVGEDGGINRTMQEASTRLPGHIAAQTARRIAETTQRRLRDTSNRVNNPQPRLGGRPWESGEMGQYSQAVAEGRIPPAAPATPVGNPELDALRAEIFQLLNKPDIPGYWESPYSQEYLNELGARLGQAGLETQAGFNAANDQIAQIYADATSGRGQANQDFFGKLGSGLSNLGIDLQSTEAGQQAATDAAYLDKVSGQNLATDQAFGTKLGELFAQQGSHLGNQAIEGLLTPKTWVPPQSGITDADRIRAQFLMDDYFARQNAANTQTELDFLSNLNQAAEEKSLQLNPGYTEQLAGVSDPRLREAIMKVYDLSGGDIPAAIKMAQENIDNLAHPGSGIAGLINQALPAVQNAPVFGNWLSGLADRLGHGTTEWAGIVQDPANDRLMSQVIEFLRGLSPTYGQAITQRNMTDRTNTNIPYNAVAR